MINSSIQDNLFFIQKTGQLTGGESANSVDELKFKNEQLFQQLLEIKSENSKLKDTLRSQGQSPSKKAANRKTEEGEDVRFRICAETLCTLVTKFMHAMRQLQKAVNHKDLDVTMQKRDFESTKNDLQA